MARGNKNNKLIQKNDLIIPEGEQAVKKRGRPKGSKNTVKTTRSDRSIQGMVNDEKRQAILNLNMTLFKLPKVNKDDPEQLRERTNLFFELCTQYNVSPTVAGYALSLGIDRTTLWLWVSNKIESIKNKECFDILKDAYYFINTQYETMLTEGKIIPVSAFFLLQNNYGYKQQTDHVITANTNDNVTDEDIANKAGLID